MAHDKLMRFRLDKLPSISASNLRPLLNLKILKQLHMSEFEKNI